MLRFAGTVPGAVLVRSPAAPEAPRRPDAHLLLARAPAAGAGTDRSRAGGPSRRARGPASPRPPRTLHRGERRPELLAAVLGPPAPSGRRPRPPCGAVKRALSPCLSAWDRGSPALRPRIHTACGRRRSELTAARRPRRWPRGPATPAGAGSQGPWRGRSETSQRPAALGHGSLGKLSQTGLPLLGPEAPGTATLTSHGGATEAGLCQKTRGESKLTAVPQTE